MKPTSELITSRLILKGWCHNDRVLFSYLRDHPNMRQSICEVWLQSETPQRPERTLAWSTMREFQRQGYMKEALFSAIPHFMDKFQIHELFVFIRPDNIASQRTALSVGFEFLKDDGFNWYRIDRHLLHEKQKYLKEVERAS